LSNDPNWKKGLLSSGAPLEFEASRQLVSKGFTVNSGYTFLDRGLETVKNISVDLQASARPPFDDPDQNSARLDILLECHHGDPDETWLFLPDPNQPEASLIPSGQSIRLIDYFSAYAVDPEPICEFEKNFPFCCKGLEIDLSTGEIESKHIHNGISNLQNALPRLLTDNVLFYISQLPAENIPFLFCPIVLTTSQLYIMQKEITEADIEKSKHINDISDSVDAVLLYSDIDPRFVTNCTRESNRLKILEKSDKTQALDQKRARYFNSRLNLPYIIIEGLNEAHRFYLNKFFSTFLVCNKNKFPQLLESLKKAVDKTLATCRFIE
jgi:hypothetical protein